MKVRARVFVTTDGNRIVIPGFWYSDDDPEIGMGSMSVVLCESMLFGVVCGFKGEDWIEIEADADGNGDLAHIPYRMTGRQFAHGAVDVMLIGGPLFEQEMSARTVEPDAAA